MGAQIRDGTVNRYQTFLFRERPPGDTCPEESVLHHHLLTIRGLTYRFLAAGSRPLAFKSDFVSFEYDLIDRVRFIVLRTLRVVDSRGCVVKRGVRDERAEAERLGPGP